MYSDTYLCTFYTNLCAFLSVHTFFGMYATSFCSFLINKIICKNVQKSLETSSHYGFALKMFLVLITTLTAVYLMYTFALATN